MRPPLRHGPNAACSKNIDLLHNSTIADTLMTTQRAPQKTMPPPVAKPETVPSLLPPDTKPFFSAVDWSAFWAAFLFALLVYGMTLAPTLTLEDSGELAVGSDHLGVPHPPGYPIWTIITWVFTRIFFFVQYRGQPNPAWAVGFASAVFGALASGITAILLCRSGRDMLRSIKRTTELIGERVECVICWCGGVSASLAFAFSPVNWSQNVIVEVYALNAFFLVTIMFLAYVWMRRPEEPLKGITWLILGMALTCLAVIGSRVILHVVNYSDFRSVGIHYVLGYLLLLLLTGIMVHVWRRRPQERLLYLMSLTFGLGLTNYQVLLLLLISLAVVMLVKDMNLFRDFVIAGIPFALFYVLASQGVIQRLVGPALHVTYLGIIHPTHPLTYAYLAGNFAILAAAYRFLPNGPRVAPAILCLELGMAVYVFMPLASETNPPINWGYPRTWEGFVHAISRGQYEKITPTDIFSARFIQQLSDYMSDLRIKFTLPIAILGILPFAAWSVRIGKNRFRALYPAMLMAGLAAILITIEEIAVPTGAEVVLFSRIYRLLILGAGILMAGGILALVVAEVDELAAKVVRRGPFFSSDRIVAALILLGMAAAVLFIAVKILALLLNPALALNSSEKMGIVLLLLVPAAAAGLVHYLMRGDRRMEMDIDRDDQKWVLATLAGFMVMSVIMVALSSPKGDIQDEFIQRVKFISSHALFAFWIGYGLIMGLAAVDTLFRGNRVITWVGVVMVTVMLPAMPLLQNAYNKNLLRTDGGAEQNSHDFGWQFGNYQLRGAEAISEELSPAEEPLPNPSFPPAMGPRAIFFGGTDPGRFVPTYMIYSANVRPDVHLITQNALADNTYMSVMRDLYGDSIWIPSVVDGNRAFQKYVEDVHAGRIPASADIKIDGGRVSVVGVGGVMLINGILAQMIFEHNKFRHSFYVEESYVIQWMYPYLTPHGLIMKINAETVPVLSGEDIRNDMDFWDWYTRRLCSDKRFLRDTCARKSFSKLRSAIAGLYAARGNNEKAEKAFLDAVQLYPLSPEANFRLADLYLRWNRVNDAIRIMDTFCAQDPGNDRAAAFVDDIKGRTAANNKRVELEALMTSGKGTLDNALALVDVYRRLGMADPARELLRNIVSQKGIPPQICLRVAQMAAEAQNPELMETALMRYTEAMPADMRGWIDLGAIRFAIRKNDQAIEALRQAIKVDKEAAITLLREDPRFVPVRSSPGFKRLME
jgi:thioredoxin-like negative regulator of GroEL